jgi:hypothetical protein
MSEKMFHTHTEPLALSGTDLWWINSWIPNMNKIRPVVPELRYIYCHNLVVVTMRRGFGLYIWLDLVHLYTQLVTRSNYNTCRFPHYKSLGHPKSS